MKQVKKLTAIISTIIVGGALTLSSINTINACTRIFMNNNPDYMVSGRNLDFFGPVNPSLIITPKGIARNGGGDNKAAKWTTRYGSVAIYANGVFPMDGMNEKGLAAHTLYYPKSSQDNNQDKPVLESLAWLNYILDNFATVNDAVEALKNDVRLVSVQLPIDYASDAKHIALEDVTGDSAIIEIDKGKVNIYHDKAYRIMTNAPSYAQHLQDIEKYKNADVKDIPGDYNSSSRFIRANYNLNNLPKPDNKYQAQGFIQQLLGNVAYPIGVPDKGGDEIAAVYEKFTQKPQDNKGTATYWSTIADLSNRSYSYKSTYAPNDVYLELKEINFSEGQPVLVIKDLNDYGKNGWNGNILSKAVAQN